MSDRLGPDSTPEEILSRLRQMNDTDLAELFRALSDRRLLLGLPDNADDESGASDDTRFAGMIGMTPEAARLNASYRFVTAEIHSRETGLSPRRPGPSEFRSNIEFVPETKAPQPGSVPEAPQPVETLEGFYDEGDQSASSPAGPMIDPTRTIDPTPPIGNDYDAGHNFGWKARSLLIGGVLVIGVGIAATSGAFSGDSGSKTATTAPVTSAPPSESPLTTTATIATTIGSAQSTPSTPVSTAPLISAAIAGVGRAGQHNGNDVWDVVTCNIRAWEGAQIKGTISGSAVGSPVSFDATTGQVDVHNMGTHPNPAASTINAQYTLVELVFAGQVSGSATCTITSVSPPPAGSTLSTDKSLWSFTSNF